jgi:hypothetical protein
MTNKSGFFDCSHVFSHSSLTSFRIRAYGTLRHAFDMDSQLVGGSAPKPLAASQHSQLAALNPNIQQLASLNPNIQNYQFTILLLQQT